MKNFPVKHQPWKVQMEGVVSRDDLVFSSRRFSAVIAPGICKTVILSPRKWRGPSMMQFVCCSSFGGQQKGLCQKGRKTGQSTEFTLFLVCLLSWSETFTGIQGEEKTLGNNESLSCLSPCPSLCTTKGLLWNTDRESNAVITMPKPFHLEFTPALYNDLSQICVRKKQSVSSISILFLLAQEFPCVWCCLLAEHE